MTNKNDGKEYRVVLLNLSNGGDYHISAGNLSFEYEQANETPFESKTELTENNPFTDISETVLGIFTPETHGDDYEDELFKRRMRRKKTIKKRKI